jgi:hypothetical protein
MCVWQSSLQSSTTSDGLTDLLPVARRQTLRCASTILANFSSRVPLAPCLAFRSTRLCPLRALLFGFSRKLRPRKSVYETSHWSALFLGRSIYNNLNAAPVSTTRNLNVSATLASGLTLPRSTSCVVVLVNATLLSLALYYLSRATSKLPLIASLELHPSD